MRILIIAAGEPMAPSGVEEQLAPTVVTQPPATEPLPVSRFDVIIDKYRNPKTPYDRDDAIEELKSLPHPTSGTVWRWLVSNLRKTGNPEGTAYEILYDTLKNAKPGSNLLAFVSMSLKAYVKDPYRRGEQAAGMPSSIYLERAKKKLSPYLLYLSDPDADGAKPIDTDILDAFPDENEQVWQQYMRDTWNNRPDKDGVKRVDRAKQWMESTLKTIEAEHPEINEELRAKYPNKFKGKKNSISSSFPLDWPVLVPFRYVLEKYGIDPALWKNPDAPYFLNGEMVSPADLGIGPSYVPHVRDSMDKGTVSTTPEPESVQQKGYDASDADRARLLSMQPETELEKQYDVQLLTGRVQSEERKRGTGFPETYFEGIPEGDAAKSKARQKLIIPGMAKFSEAVQQIVKQLYDPNGTPTQQALYDVGMTYAKLGLPEAGVNPAEAQRKNQEIQNAAFMRNQDLFESPLDLRHLPEDPDRPMNPRQRWSSALGEVMRDMLEYLGNDEKYSKLRRAIRLAGFSSISGWLLRHG